MAVSCGAIVVTDWPQCRSLIRLETGETAEIASKPTAKKDLLFPYPLTPGLEFLIFVA